MAESELPDFELLEGSAAFAAKAAEMVAGARMELALLTQELNERVYSTENFVAVVRGFVLQHRHARLRVLVNHTQRAISGGSRIVEFGRKMTSFVEFRELLPERRMAVREEYLIADGRQLLYRETPETLESKYYGALPHHAHLKLKSFDTFWNESLPAQELRSLGI